MIKKNRNITDEWLCAIGKHRPLRLTLSQCHGNKVTTKGLRELFRSCSDTLEVMLHNCFLFEIQSILGYRSCQGCRLGSVTDGRYMTDRGKLWLKFSSEALEAC